MRDVRDRKSIDRAVLVMVTLRISMARSSGGGREC